MEFILFHWWAALCGVWESLLAQQSKGRAGCLFFLFGGLWARQRQCSAKREDKLTARQAKRAQWNGMEWNEFIDGVNFVDESINECQWNGMNKRGPKQFHCAASPSTLFNWMLARPSAAFNKEELNGREGQTIPFFNHQSKINQTIQSKTFDWLWLIVWIDWLISLHSLL